MASLSMNIETTLDESSSKGYHHCLDSTELKNRLEVMMRSERTVYKCCDYLSSDTQNVSPATTESKIVDEECRYKMIDWCHQVVEFCDFRRETVAISANILDRYLSTGTERTKDILSDRSQYQLAAMTALYTSIKIHEPLEMEANLVSELSRGWHSAQEIVDMESEILSGVSWRLAAPTMLEFVQHFIALLASSMDSAVQSVITEFARFQVEMAVLHYGFVTENPSVVALSAILNALHGVPTTKLSSQARSEFVATLWQVSEGHLPHNDNKVGNCRMVLTELFALANNNLDLVGEVRVAISSLNEDEEEIFRSKSPANDLSSLISISSVKASSNAMSPVSVVQQ